MHRTELSRHLPEAVRRARVANTSATAESAPQAPGALATGTMTDAGFVKYGRVGITAVSDGFLPRLD